MSRGENDLNPTNIIGGYVERANRAYPNGRPVRARFSPLGDLMISQGQLRHLDVARRGQSYTVAKNATGVFTNLTGTTGAATGLGIGNPEGSGVLIALISAKGLTAAVPAGFTTFGLFSRESGFAAIVASLAAGVSKPNFLGGGERAAKGLPFDTCTLPGNASGNPTIHQWIGGGAVAAAATSVTPAQGQELVPEGGILLSPGAYVFMASLTTALTGLAHLIWEEIDAEPRFMNPVEE